VSSDGSGIVCQAGGVVLAETLRVSGLGRDLSAALERWRPSRAVHDPGKVVADLALSLVLGGDCLADIAILRSSPEVYGPVASDPTVSRTIGVLAKAGPTALRAIRKVRAAARERVWALAGDAAPSAGGELIPVDLDATIVIAHSEKDQAAPTWKHTFGFHPMTAFIDHRQAGTGEAAAIVLRVGAEYRVTGPDLGIRGARRLGSGRIAGWFCGCCT
jgi:hypothetical protein